MQPTDRRVLGAFIDLVERRRLLDAEIREVEARVWQIVETHGMVYHRGYLLEVAGRNVTARPLMAIPHEASDEVA